MQDRSKERKKIERKMTDYMYLTMGDRERNKSINMKPWFSNDTKVILECYLIPNDINWWVKKNIVAYHFLNGVHHFSFFF